MGVSSVTYIVVVPAITLCKPLLPTSAADGLTLKLPPPVLAEVQAEKLPLSKPSAKIRSGKADVGVCVGVFVGVGEGPMVGVKVAVKVAVGVGVVVGVAVGKVPTADRLKASTSLAVRPHVLPSK